MHIDRSISYNTKGDVLSLDTLHCPGEEGGTHNPIKGDTVS